MKYRPLIKAGGPLVTAAMWAGGGFEAAPPAAGILTPTVVLNIGDAGNATWGNDSNEFPPPDGGYCTKTVTGTGGPFLSSLAILAGATEPPTYNTGQGIHTLGANAALACATPVVIPADADCVIYIKCVLASFGDIILGCSTSGAYIVFGGTGGWAIVNASAAGTFCYGEPTDATFLARARRTSGVWTFAWTGQAEIAADGGGTLGNAAITLDTLLAQGNGATLNGFSPTGQYLQKAYIFHGSSTPDTAYETANGGIL